MSFPNVFSKNLAVNFLLLLIPVTNIIGNLALNVNIALLILFVLIAYGLKIFRIKYNLIDKLVCIFFIYVFLNGVFNNFLNFDFPTATDKNLILIKSFLFLRYIVLYFVIRFLTTNEIIDFKLLFYTFGLCAFFVSSDILIQFLFGKNLFGMEGSGRRLSGIFGAEYIAGGFIQKFFPFLPFAILFYSKIKNLFFTQLIIFSTLLISIFGILVSGNRIPLIMTFLIIFLMFFYEKKLRKTIASLVIVFLLGVSFLFKTNTNTLYHFGSFKDRSIEFIIYFQTKIFNKQSNENYYGFTAANAYVKEVESGILTWQQNKIFGGGLKSFFFHCNKMIKKDKKHQKFINNCNTHPHNYYLDISVSLGIIGLILLILIFSLILVASFKFIRSNKNIELKNILIPFYILFIAEIFPFKTTGSFFTTITGNYLFIILAIIVGLIELNTIKDKYEKK